MTTQGWDAGLFQAFQILEEALCCIKEYTIVSTGIWYGDRQEIGVAGYVLAGSGFDWQCCYLPRITEAGDDA